MVLAMSAGLPRTLSKTAIPNALSLFRVLAAPVLLWLAWADRPKAFVVLYALTLASDCADGFLARRLHAESVLGARLDSYGDLAMVVAVPLGALRLWPEILVREAVFIAAGLLSYFVPTLVGVIKYGRPTSYHTWGAKLSAVLVGASLLLLFLDVSPWPFRVCIPFAVLEGLEEITMTVMLRRWHANVPTSWHAWRLRRAEREGVS
jgi:CDP-diacylglycerol--glycerol-3-phosphate 3-phosphatidyltransferase